MIQSTSLSYGFQACSMNMEVHENLVCMTQMTKEIAMHNGQERRHV